MATPEKEQHSYEGETFDKDQSHDNEVILDTRSPGVRKIEAISSSFTTTSLTILFVGIFLASYAYGLDGSTRYVYQTSATNSFEVHSLLSTLNVVKSIIAAAAQPPMSKAADVFGRFELVTFSAFFYVLGTIIEASSKNIQTYAGGQVLWQLGLTGFQLLFEVLIADLSSTRNRVLMSYIPALPFLINAWISGNVTSAILANSTWEWGVGMWCIIMPFVCIPIYVALIMARRKAARDGKLVGIVSGSKNLSIQGKLIWFFWQMDVIGVILLTAMLSLILIPLTVAGGVKANWQQPYIIIMLVFGVICIPLFVIWESKFARHPCVPFKLLNNRTILAGLLMAMLLNMTWYLQGDYLYTVLSVSFDESVMSATRITSLYSFCSVISGVVGGFFIRYIRHIKWVAVTGTFLYITALGLMIKYRSAADNGHAGVIGAQILLGIAGGLFPYPVQALVQAATKHEHVAMITALYLTTYQIGSGIGNSVSGAIWTNTLPAQLEQNLAPINSSLAAIAYSSPFTFIAEYPMGTPERSAVIEAYNYAQRLLTITGTCLAIPLIIAAFLLGNPRLEDTQALDSAETSTQGTLNEHQDDVETK
ncbi:hypothetical protein INT44_001425 [Umbelopsis vinacea]|uniref:Uncharacterized protein n=1 Tax=Umbelopsis vinacea TaxID=44442 RepID=A0A8H7PR63_9FUNG|nr:hypothetical protein INT44_001425 [Umbelopsis vinacea]